MGHSNRRQELGVADGVHQVSVRGKTVYFTFGYRFGPLITDYIGEPLKPQPVSENHPFWAPFKMWLDEYGKTHPNPYAWNAKPRPNAAAQHNRDPQP